MKELKVMGLLVLSLCFLLSGCIVRTYESTRDRVDQGVTGNAGYLQGSAPASMETAEHKTTRTIRVVEMELRSPLKFEKGSKQVQTKESAEQVSEGNRGYITESVTPEMAGTSNAGNFEKYTVQKGDTLQKISQKLFGTTKKWYKIFEANKDTLKGANKIYPGQVINIPESAKQAGSSTETTENLK